MANSGWGLGIDFGGSGIKGAPVDLTKGEFAADRLRIPTPKDSTPDNVVEVIREILDHFSDDLPQDSTIGITVPGVVQQGVVKTAANINKAWAGCEADDLFTEKLKREVHLVNDADAAGLAEVRFGAAQGVDGVVLLTTLGTGIGSALIHNGVLVPNTELGHVHMAGQKGPAERDAATSAKEREDLSWKEWSKRLQDYYDHLCFLFSPDLIVVGGGVSKDAEKFLPRLDLPCPIVPAQLMNRAGIIGAAVLASELG